MGPRFGTGRCFASRKDLKDTVTRPMSDSEGDMPARSKTVQPIAGTNYYTHGLATYGWLPELTIDLVDNLQAPGAGALRRSAEAYLDMWERTYPPADAPPPITTTNGTVALGGSCTKGDECESGRCTGMGGLKGVCVCNEDPDCGTGRFCNAGFGTNSCVTKLADGQACKGDNQCASLGSKCSQWRPQDGQVSGICYKPESKSAGQSCVIDLECKTGKCNSNKTCVCNSDTDCSPSWCDKGFDAHENSCKPKLDNGQVCGHTGEFDLDRRCKSGKCKAQKLLSTTFTCQ